MEVCADLLERFLKRLSNTRANDWKPPLIPALARHAKAGRGARADLASLVFQGVVLRGTWNSGLQVRSGRALSPVSATAKPIRQETHCERLETGFETLGYVPFPADFEIPGCWAQQVWPKASAATRSAGNQN